MSFPQNYANTNQAVATWTLENMFFHQEKSKQSSGQTQASPVQTSLAGVSPKAMQRWFQRQHGLFLAAALWCFLGCRAAELHRDKEEGKHSKEKWHLASTCRFHCRNKPLLDCSHPDFQHFGVSCLAQKVYCLKGGGKVPSLKQVQSQLTVLNSVQWSFWLQLHMLSVRQQGNVL